MITFRNPETGQIVKAQFTDSWMFEKQGLRLLMDGMGPGYAFEINTLASPLQFSSGTMPPTRSPIPRPLSKKPPPRAAF